jgi:hypothetical protein
LLQDQQGQGWMIIAGARVEVVVPSDVPKVDVSTIPAFAWSSKTFTDGTLVEGQGVVYRYLGDGWSPAGNLCGATNVARGAPGQP